MIDRSVSTICNIIARESGVDPRYLYCLSSGQIIGEIHVQELAAAIDAMPDSFDSEEVCDELLMRTLAYTRPSPAWNYMRPDSLDRMRLFEPVKLACYLMNRLYDNHRGSRKDMSFEQRINYAKAHIEQAEIIQRLFHAGYHEDDSEQDAADERMMLGLNRVLLCLLELDATFGLSNLQPPRTIPHIASIDNADALKGFIDALESWTSTLRWEAQKAAATAMSPIRTSNALAKKAFVEQFVAHAVPTESQLKKQAKAAVIDSYVSIIDQIMAGESFSDAPAPAPAPKTGAVVKGKFSFGVKAAPATTGEGA